MEQVFVILREYANEVMIVYGGCVVLLLLVALHRIRQIEKRMRKLLECVVNTSDAVVQNMSGQALLQEELTKHESAITGITESSSKNETKERPEELIDAVLGEIFP